VGVHGSLDSIIKLNFIKKKLPAAGILLKLLLVAFLKHFYKMYVFINCYTLAEGIIISVKSLQRSKHMYILNIYCLSPVDDSI